MSLGWIEKLLHVFFINTRVITASYTRRGKTVCDFRVTYHSKALFFLLPQEKCLVLFEVFFTLPLLLLMLEMEDRIGGPGAERSVYVAMMAAGSAGDEVLSN